MQSIGQRIKQKREEKGFSLSTLAMLIGKSPNAKTTISSWERDASEPSQKDIQLLATALEISTTQLLVGDEIQFETHNNVYLVPLLPAPAYMGIIEMYEQIPNILTETYPVYYPPGEKPQPNHFVAPVKGRSMEPVLFDGAKVLLEEVPLHKVKYAEPGFYAIVFDSSFAIKEIRENEIISANYLKLYSRNPPDTFRIVEAEQIRKVWKVKAIVYQELHP
jgi:transcriptional regulator with XRE-family HTH domain